MNIFMFLVAVTLMAIGFHLGSIRNSLSRMSEQESTLVYEEVVEVVGLATYPFDGLGATVGYLVKSHDGLKVIPLSQGLMGKEPVEIARPQFLTVLHSSTGEMHYNALLVD
ncbi:MAG: hypothetical protein A2589_03045 [Candidatus Vogelbacteria bacterium RIFOXYD1_FULL_46_19]|uniref:Uncharacterized protein n=1 Tax=Candidatus Vogelbacteria bacterium RIFOXYD1_FULL_46_19 TaxID=1802439 RepID=A0A1G2QIK5_9BACT|nr:MAG: hypothetical protein A2589_03045 [Candidatus Vogelbacteria bacterium RIFOXYD1_FULL_46_19]